MKFWQAGMHNVSRIILVLFLLLLLGLGIFWALSKFMNASPLQHLAAKDARWIAVMADPGLAASMLEDKDLVSDMQLTAMIPGANREKLTALVGRLPVGTVLAGYASTTVAAFQTDAASCAGYALDALQATARNGLCLLHVGALPGEILETKEGSLRSAFGAQLPDTTSPIRGLLTANFPAADMLGQEITPEVLFLRALASKRFPVAWTLDQTSRGDLRLRGHVLLDSKQALPEVLQRARVSRAALQSVPAEGGYLVFALDKAMPAAFQEWLRTQFSEEVVRLGNHLALSQTERFTPVDIDVANLPTASIALSWPQNGQGWSAVLTDLDEADKKAVDATIRDALTFLYGIEETATTLPDKTRGVLVTASMENIEQTTETMSGTVMTTYSAKNQPRLTTEVREDTMRLREPGIQSGAVLKPLEVATLDIPWILPVDEQQAALMRLPFRETGRDLYIGLLFLRDRLSFDIALTPRS